MPSSPPHSQDGHFCQQPIKTHNKKMNWNAEQCGTTKCKWSQAMSKYKNYAPTPAKKSFIFFHITVIQCPAVASIHDYISTKGVGGGRGQCMIVAFFFKGEEKKGEKK